MIKRRLGPGPHANGETTSAADSCPDIFELDDGRFAIIGIDKTDEIIKFLPADASCGADERIIVIDRHILVKAKDDIPPK